MLHYRANCVLDDKFDSITIKSIGGNWGDQPSLPFADYTPCANQRGYGLISKRSQSQSTVTRFLDRIQGK